MAIVQPMLFDVETNQYGKPVMYVIGNDRYLYVAELKENPADMVWVKGKSAAVGPSWPSSVMKVYKSVVYYEIDNVFHITKNFGDSWETHNIHVNLYNGYYYLACLHVEDTYALMGYSSAGGVIKSVDGGMNWSEVDGGQNDYPANAISANAKFVAIGCTRELMVSLQGRDEWKRFRHTSVFGGYFLEGIIADVVFDDRYSSIYVIHENGVSYGTIGTNGQDINIEWKKPFTNVTNFSGIQLGTTAYVSFGPGYLYTMHEGDSQNNEPGKSIVYSMAAGDNIKPSMVISLTAPNPYAQYRDLNNVTSSQLRKLGDYTVYLSALAVLSVSYMNRTWQQIVVNV